MLSVAPASQIAMGTFIVSFIGNGFVVSAQGSPLFSRLSPKARRRLLVLLYFTVGTPILRDPAYQDSHCAWQVDLHSISDCIHGTLCKPSAAACSLCMSMACAAIQQRWVFGRCH